MGPRPLRRRPDQRPLDPSLETGEVLTSPDSSGEVSFYLNAIKPTCACGIGKESGVIGQDTPTLYAAGQTPPPWTPHTAWQEFVGSFEQAAATTQPANSPPPSVVITPDTLNGLSVVRFDHFGIDALGRRFLYVQLWADPRTHLPVRIKTRLQVGEPRRQRQALEHRRLRLPRHRPRRHLRPRRPARYPHPKRRHHRPRQRPTHHSTPSIATTTTSSRTIAPSS